MSGEPRPEWLPEGWTMRVHAREGGKRRAKKDWYYMSQASGFTCRSKVEVMRYLEIEKNAGHTTGSTPCFGNDKNQLVVRVENSPEWLPSGWILEIRTRTNGATAGRKYKCYFDPFTGSRFYSKGEVFQYLTSGKLLTPTTDQKASIKTSSTGEICTSSNNEGSMVSSINNKFMDNCSPDGLPHGWIKEIKVRKTNTKYGVRKDPYYTDPVSGYVFRSLKDVYRYIETGEVGRHAFRSSKRQMNEMYSKEKECHPPIAAEKPMPRGTVARRCLFSGKVPNSIVLKIDELPERSDLLFQGHPSAQGTGAADSSCFTPSNVDHLRKGTEDPSNQSCHGVRISPKPLNVKPLDERSLHPSERNELYMVNEERPMMEELAIVKHLQPGDEKLLVPEDKPSEERQFVLMNEKQSQPVYRKLRRAAKKRRVAKWRGSGDPSGSPKQGSRVRSGPRPKALKAITMPLRSSKRLAGLKADPVVNSGISDGSPRAVAKRPQQLPANRAQGYDQRGGSNQTSGGSDELKPTTAIDLELPGELESKVPPGEQAAVCDQTGARKPSNDSHESPFILPFGDSWPDPCIQFAFETLTGDIPVLEDTAAIQDYFQQKLISIQGPSLSSSASSSFGCQPDRRACSLENGLMPEREANKDPTM